MSETRAIVLQSFRYSDDSLITHLLTEDEGLKSFIIKGAYKRNARIKAAFFQIMTPLNIVRAPSRSSLAFLREVSIEYPFTTIPYNVVKQSVLLFMGELLSKTILEPEENPQLFHFVHDSLVVLDTTTDSIANFPLVFSARLSTLLGFSFSRDDEDFKELLSKEMIDLFERLFTLDYSNMTLLKIGAETRRSALQNMMTYFKMYVAGFRDINSFEVLREILS